MCGITGFWDPRAACGSELLHATVTQMRDTLYTRGPDSADNWVDPSAGIALGHRRLAILDLSEHGQQPMQSDRFAIVFNGEIYNHAAIKAELAHKNWRGHSDTEVILQAFSELGITRTLALMTGMFAIALWDKQERQLYLMRDRLGEKPLYYGWLGCYFVFGSELKSLRAHFAWQQSIDPDAVNLFMQYNCIPAPHTIYTGIKKLQPGHYAVIKADRSIQDHVYWDLRPPVQRLQCDPQTAVEGLHRCLSQAVRQQMVADVPLGAFLSGGIDSSTIVALMQAQSSRPVRTFTIGFYDQAYNEAEQAKAIAAHLGTEHTELYCTAEQTQAIIPDLPNFYDEPFADSSQVPTYLVAKLTRQHVKVSLSGDGGDELFAGYNRYQLLPTIWRKVGFLPLPIRKWAAQLLLSIPPTLWDKILFKLRTPGDKIHKLAGILDAKTPELMYQRLISHWGSKDFVSMGVAQRLPLVESMMYLDTLRYLPDDILVKVDRAAMAVSLETRVPFLDHHVVEYAWSLPLDYKIRNGQSKWLVRQVLQRYVPAQLIDRPKMGFGVPLDQWLRGPLREWATDLLGNNMLNKHGLLHNNVIAKKWREHQSGTRNWQYHLWDALMFQAWYEAHHA